MEEWQGRKLYTFDLVQEWMRDGIYKTDGFITHRFPLDRYKDASEESAGAYQDRSGLRVNRKRGKSI